MRESIAAMALIQRQTNGQTTILTQWNDRWECFHLVGGHKHPDESFRECAIREMEEELVLKHPADFRVDLEPVGCAKFMAWSNAAQQTTRYIMEVFRAEFACDAARIQVDRDPRNRWLTLEEITAGRCGDGRPVSATLPQILTQIGLLEPSPIFQKGTAQMSRPTTDVAVTLIRNSKNEVLLVYSEKWGSYTLPMTKRRKPLPGDDESVGEAEDWLDAAARNVVECLGRPAIPKPVLKTPVPESHFSKREQITKDYLFHVLEERFRDSDSDPGEGHVGPPDCVNPKTPHVWAKPEQILQRLIRPLSHTAHDLIAFDEIVKLCSTWN